MIGITCALEKYGRHRRCVELIDVLRRTAAQPQVADVELHLDHGVARRNAARAILRGGGLIAPLLPTDGITVASGKNDILAPICTACDGPAIV